MLISVIIPCYHEEEVLEATWSRLKAVAEKVPWEAEFLFVNDGSRDRTLPILEAMAAESPAVRVVSFARNFGHQAAVSAGLRYASGDAAVIIDADLQDPPELIPDMVAMWQNEGADIVYGQRRSREGETLFKRLTAKLFYRSLNRLSEIEIPLDTGDFRLVSRKVIDAFNALPEHNKYIRGLMPWLGFSARPIEYDRDARFAGETKYPLKKMLGLAANGLLSFSRKPLMLAAGFGGFTMLICLALIIYVFISFFSPAIDVVPGWASTVLIVLFFSGVQLLTLGIIGAYIGRIYDEVKQRPEYVIDRILGGKDDR